MRLARASSSPSKYGILTSMKRLIAALGLLIPGAALCQDPQPYADPGMKKIAQVAIVCKDVEACRARWAALLGMKPEAIRTTRPGSEVKMVVRGKPSNAQTKLTFFNTGDAILELMQPLGGDSEWQRHLDKHGEGVQHLGFQVVDLEKTVKSLEQQGMAVIHRGRYDTDNGDYVYMDSQSKLGVTVELLHSDKPKQ